MSSFAVFNFLFRNLLETACECEEFLPPSAVWLPPVLDRLDGSFPDGYSIALEYFKGVAASSGDAKTAMLPPLMERVKSRVVANSIAASVSIDDNVSCGYGAVACVQEITCLMAQLTGCHGKADSLSIAHSLLSKTVSAVRQYGVHKTKDSAQSLTVRAMRVANSQGQILYELVASVAKNCLPLVRFKGTASVELKEEVAAEGDESIVLLAAKLLRVLIVKEKRNKSSIKTLLSNFGVKQLHFLASIWSWSFKMGLESKFSDDGASCDSLRLPHEDIIDPTLQLWCLKRGLFLLQEDSSQELPAGFLLSLLPPLTSEALERQQMRACALDMVELCYSSNALKYKLSKDLALVKVLLKNKTQICVDSFSDHFREVVAHSCDKGDLLLYFVRSLSSPHPPHIMSAILFSVSKVKHPDILRAILPLLKSKLQECSEPLRATDSILLYWCIKQFNQESAALLADSEEAWSVFLSIVKCREPVVRLGDESLSPLSLIVHQIVTEKIMKHVSSCSLSGRMWTVLASAAADMDSSSKLVSKLHKAIKGVHLHSCFVLQQIQGLEIGVKATNIKGVQAQRIKLQQAKRKKLLAKEEEDEDQLPRNWRQLNLLLELLCDVAHIDEPWTLITPLSNCLQEALVLGLNLAERVVQQLLTSLHLLVDLTLKNPPAGKQANELCVLSIEMIVQIIRESSEPCTHRRALQLLSLMASVSPEAVLHNCMAIFTFMGEGLLQRDDEFSYHVIHSTIETLIPLLVKYNQSLEMVASVIQAFVDALPDIPVHRRLLVFSVLTKALQPSDNLWLVLMLIIKGYVMHGKSRLPEEGDAKKSMPKEITFALQLSSEFDAMTQIGAAETMLNIISDTPSNIGIDYKKKWNSANPKTKTLELNEFASKQLRHLIYTSAGVLVQLFVSESFIAKVLLLTESKSASVLKKLHDNLGNILDCLSRFYKHVTDMIPRTQATDALACKFWPSLQRKLLEVFESICNILQPHMLIEITSQLLQSQVMPAKVKAVEILRSRLLPSADFFNLTDHLHLLLPFIESLTITGTNGHSSLDLQQISLSTLRMLLSFIGKAPISHLEAVVKSVMPLVVDGKASQLLVVQALLVLAECIGSLGTEAVELLPYLMPTLLKHFELKANSFEDSEAHLPLATLTTLDKIVKHMPNFLVPYTEELVHKLCIASSLLTSAAAKESKLYFKLSNLGSLLHHKVDPRYILPALHSTYQKLTSSGKQLHCAGRVLDLLASIINRLAAGVEKHISSFREIFTLVLGTRHNHPHPSLKTAVLELEDQGIELITQLMLQLDQSSNLGLFSSLCDWADEASSAESIATLYKVVYRIASAFRVIFIESGLADHIFNHWLRTLSLTTQQQYSEDSACDILHYLLSSMATVFSHDSVNFVSEARFELLAEALLVQVLICDFIPYIIIKLINLLSILLQKSKFF